MRPLDPPPRHLESVVLSRAPGLGAVQSFQVILIAVKLRSMIDTARGHPEQSNFVLLDPRPPAQSLLSPSVKILSLLQDSSQKNPTFRETLSPGCDLSLLSTPVGLDSFFLCDLYFGTFCTVTSWVFAFVQDWELLEAGGQSFSSLPGLSGVT